MSRAETTVGRRVDFTMSLLVDTMAASLDPAYAEAAKRRDAAPAASRRPWAVVGVAAVAVGLVLAIGAVQTHDRAPDAARTRARLVDAVQARTHTTETLQQQLDRLRTQTSNDRARLLATSGAGAALDDEVNSLEAAAGTVPLHGDGLRVRLDDAPAADNSNPLGGTDPRAGTGDAVSRVLDRDLQQVVNALWAAGARGIAINGERLTAQTAIRSAGSAILVAYRPLSPPYDITAVGDPVGLETRFGTSATADRFRAYHDLYGLRFTYVRVRGVTLPAASALSLRYAAPVSGSQP